MPGALATAFAVGLPMVIYGHGLGGRDNLGARAPSEFFVSRLESEGARSKFAVQDVVECTSKSQWFTALVPLRMPFYRLMRMCPAACSVWSRLSTVPWP